MAIGNSKAEKRRRRARTVKKPVSLFNRIKNIKLTERQQDCLYILLIAIILGWQQAPMTIDGLRPVGLDTLADIGASHQYAEWQKQTGGPALWNPYILGGMPVYMRVNPQAYSIDNFMTHLEYYIDDLRDYYSEYTK